MLLCEKYAPNSLSGIIGNTDAVNHLLEFAAQVHSGKAARPILIYGNSGVGKTASVHAIAYSNGFELLEFNASDYRDSETLNKKLVPAARTRNLFGKKILVLFDEIDELSSKFDSGVEQIITKLLRNSRHPIIFTANDYWNRKIAFLRDNVEKLEFKRPKKNEVVKLLNDILKKEGKELDEKVVNEIATRSNGDIRGALNDLELMIDSDPNLVEHIGIRDRKSEIFNVLDKIFLSSNFEIAKNSMLNSDVDLGMMINWVEQNIPAKYLSKDSRREAYEQLSNASLFNEKASRTNYYGYLRYTSILLSSGISIANDGAVSMLTPYSFPSSIKYLSRTKKERDQLNSTALKLTPILHSNKREIVSSYLPMFKIMLDKAAKEYGRDVVFEFMLRRFGLEEKETEEILNYTFRS